MHSPGIKVLLLIALSTALFAFSLSAGAAQEQDEEPHDTGLDLFDNDVEGTRMGWSRFTVAAGLAYLDADGALAAQLPHRPPVTIIDFDRVGLKETDSSHWLSMTWRSDNSRWGAWFGNWRCDVNGVRNWDREVQIPDGPLIPVGAWVKSEFDATWYILEATYSVFRTETVDAGIGIGVHTVNVDTRLEARIDVDFDDPMAFLRFGF